MKVISNRDGCSGKREETYASHEACSYRVEDQHGKIVGSIAQVKRYNPRPEFLWSVSVNGQEKHAFQYFADAKRYAKTGEAPAYFAGYATYDPALGYTPKEEKKYADMEALIKAIGILQEIGETDFAYELRVIHDTHYLGRRRNML